MFLLTPDLLVIPYRGESHNESVYTVVERCMETGLFVGFVPGFSGAHFKGETLDEGHNALWAD